MGWVFGRRRRRSTGGFTPAAISGLTLWLRADLGITLNGSDVSSWADQSGQGNDHVQGTASLQPAFTADAINGHPVVSFDGVDERLACADVPASSEYTIFAVARMTAGTTGGIINLDDAIRVFQFKYSAADTFTFLGFADDGNVNASDTQTITSGDYSVIVGVRRTAELEVYVDGASDGATALVGDPMAGSTISTVGAGASGSELIVGDIAEVGVYGSALSTTDREALESYLATRYGL